MTASELAKTLRSAESVAILCDETETGWVSMDYVATMIENQDRVITARVADVERLMKRVQELEAERQQWECDWNNAADYDLIRDALDGKPVEPAVGSVAGNVLTLANRVKELEQALEALGHIAGFISGAVAVVIISNKAWRFPW